MLTDDDLTRELGDAFRAATDDLRYAGRTRPPRPITAVLPAAVAASTLGAVAIGGVYVADRAAPAGAPKAVAPIITSARPTAPAVAKPTRVTRTLKLAGFSVTFRSAAGAPDPVFAEPVHGGLPAGVTAVPLSGTAAQAWTGTDPSTGDNALYVKVPTASGSRLFVLLSATWSEQQLIELFRSPQPTAVPEVPGN